METLVAAIVHGNGDRHAIADRDALALRRRLDRDVGGIQQHLRRVVRTASSDAMRSPNRRIAERRHQGT